MVPHMVRRFIKQPGFKAQCHTSTLGDSNLASIALQKEANAALVMAESDICLGNRSLLIHDEFMKQLQAITMTALVSS